MGGWGCPHEVDGKCQRVLNRPCDIGMKGCVLFGRFVFADPSKNRAKNKSGDIAEREPSSSPEVSSDKKE